MDLARRAGRRLPRGCAPALQESAEGDRQVYLWLALGFSVLYLLMTGVMLLARQGRERRLKKMR